MTGPIAFTPEMLMVLGILAVAVWLFAFEIVRVDLAALIVLVLIGLTTLIPDYPGLVEAHLLFSGYSSNAVISIIAVMIIGAGLERTGGMDRLANQIQQIGVATEARMIALLSATVGVISSFMQNIGAAALFLPVVSRVARHGDLPVSRLLMPMGFCAILGGTITMVGSSPLILLNDLLANSPGGGETTFGLFAVMPIGLTLLAIGITYFVLFGRFVLPEAGGKLSESVSMLRYFSQQYGIEGEVYECRVSRDSPLIGRTLSYVDAAGRAGWIIAIRSGNETVVAPRGDTQFYLGTELAIMGQREAVLAFAAEYALIVKNEMDVFANLLSPSSAGIAEIVIPPDSVLVGQTVREAQLRKRYGVTVLSVYRADQVIDRNMAELMLQSGDTLIIHCGWQELTVLADNRHDFAVITDFPRRDTRPDKLLPALICFIITLGLALFSDLRLSAALMTGAAGMLLVGALKIDEAYRAISWQSVFLLASLIPLGIAMETTGTAAWLAQAAVEALAGMPVWVLMAALAVLATGFTLVMSNVGATVLLVPIAVNIAQSVGADPAVFALAVALSTSNSFLLPTHQVNALIMGPGGYRVADFIRAGVGMTALFLVTVVSMLNLFFL